MAVSADAPYSATRVSLYLQVRCMHQTQRTGRAVLFGCPRAVPNTCGGWAAQHEVSVALEDQAHSTIWCMRRCIRRAQELTLRVISTKHGLAVP